MKEKVVFFQSISSDIGLALAKAYAEKGYLVTGTYRKTNLLGEIKKLNGYFFECELLDHNQLNLVAESFSDLGIAWDIYISCASTCAPLQSFFEADFDLWMNGLRINALEHLRLLHLMYRYRQKNSISNVVFFTGPGTNGAPKNFSAAVTAKILLFKICELLHVENEDLNVFIVGPGWTKTKTHYEILNSPYISKEKYHETLDFIRNKQGTSMEDIFSCIDWLCNQGREVAGGRNFSVVHDYWGTEDLADILKKDTNMYKLRRYRNNWKDKERHNNGRKGKMGRSCENTALS